jgi:cobalt-zinc-cadmium efflux system outer membrane protein
MVEAAEASLRLERKRVFPTVELGLSLEREARSQSHHNNPLADAVGRAASGEPGLPIFGQEDDSGQEVVMGPSLGLELPVFDQNQAGITKAQFALEQALRLSESLRRQIVQEVYGAAERMRVAAENVRFYRDQVLPLRETNLQLTREGYRAGKTSFLAVLEAQRVLLATRARSIELQQVAALARTDLEKVSGQPFERILSSSGTVAASSRSDNGSKGGEQ